MNRITLLQLDTHFPRIPGDVGSVDTYRCELEIIRVPNATVEQVVNANPFQIDLDRHLTLTGVKPPRSSIGRSFRHFRPLDQLV